MAGISRAERERRASLAKTKEVPPKAKEEKFEPTIEVPALHTEPVKVEQIIAEDPMLIREEETILLAGQPITIKLDEILNLSSEADLQEVMVQRALGLTPENLEEKIEPLISSEDLWNISSGEVQKSCLTQDELKSVLSQQQDLSHLSKNS